ncbi:hypothetical protein N7463_009694 [Penicillium fimorum]|uniref:Winged helix-turn helix domain-containing protein n=1 Tax=Penicillium fimorum TaxID=1882269 RepID=A0A9W9XIG4_9EURO|nr:hypothetical protein N7463_009694 [Penicillium fimorum]
MAIFLWDEFRTTTTTSNIRRALVAKGWTNKTAQQNAKEHESGCDKDKRAGFRRTGWSPSGVAPLQVSQFHSGQ